MTKVIGSASHYKNRKLRNDWKILLKMTVESKKGYKIKKTA